MQNATSLPTASSFAPSFASSPRIGAPLSGEPRPALQWIEVASSLQLPGFQIIGLPSPEVAEARERVRAAIDSSGLEFPRRRVVLNLSPASIRKRGTGLDLAMALAILLDSHAPRGALEGSLVAWGELGLDGSVKPARQLARALYAAWEGAARRMIVAAEELPAARETLALLERGGKLAGPPPELFGAATLEEAWDLVSGKAVPARAATRAPDSAALPTPSRPLLALPRPMERLIGVAASGSHHLLLLGPRGTGKSHALEWLASLQPLPSDEARVRHALLRELGGEAACGDAGPVVRRVGAQARPAALIGSVHGELVRPGEFSLAHGGLLIADEFPEWSRDTRETLREPLESGRVTLTRARRSVELEARFTLAANGNLCPCGGWPPEMRPRDGGGRVGCSCAEPRRKAYLARLPGPVLDRIDLVHVLSGIEAPADDEGLSLEALREKVESTRERSLHAWGAPAGQLSADRLEALLRAHPRWRQGMEPELFTSFRARHKVLRVALTLAAWDGGEDPSACFYEAGRYRPEYHQLLG